jgi:hypothetical protein
MEAQRLSRAVLQNETVVPFYSAKFSWPKCSEIGHRNGYGRERVERFQNAQNCQNLSNDRIPAGQRCKRADILPHTYAASTPVAIGSISTTSLFPCLAVATLKPLSCRKFDRKVHLFEQLRVKGSVPATCLLKYAKNGL